MQLLELMASSGVLESAVVNEILGKVSDDGSVGTPLGSLEEGDLDSPDIIDVVVGADGSDNTVADVDEVIDVGLEDEEG